MGEGLKGFAREVRRRVKGYAPEAPSELENLNYLCEHAEGRLYRAMKDGAACLMNDGSLVYKFDTSMQETWVTGTQRERRPDERFRGVPVALCVRDSGPFKRGEWYWLTNKEHGRELLKRFALGERVFDFPIDNKDWRIMRDVKKNNKSPELLTAATQYAETLSTKKISSP